MHIQEQRKLEQQILGLLDQLIDEASQVSMLVGPYREERFEEGARLSAQLAVLCELLVEGRREYVEPTMRQLLQQKLPHPAVLRSFGEFQRTLEDYLKAGIARRQAEWNSGTVAVGGAMPLLPEKDVTSDAGALCSAAAEQAASANRSGPATAAALRQAPSKQHACAAANTPKSTAKAAGKEEKESGKIIVMRALKDIYPQMEVIAGSPPGLSGIAAYVPAKGLAVCCDPEPKGASRLEFACRQRGLKLAYISPTDMHSPSRLKRALLRTGIR
ncbi:hypothetical protein HM1_2501 [Heliomicrobium modesticaldum Ice1]|uniref:Uncharacterized protein n=1 Tax=Heliobacterium modesticaldum (strain ATCC 51547 / Ice1) TaxID=498761 RepID=B0TAJ9_HELMI|nr:hypothetical protein [Heliomicrobium modesticaldum]ABZ85049.1 hypothetical protein HM1_2501 [Heliomicrobium modesticaldum Ice1]